MKELLTTKSDLSLLPVELIVAIGSMLTPTELEASALVSKEWHTFFTHNDIWKQKIIALHPGFAPECFAKLTLDLKVQPLFYKNLYFRLEKIFKLQEPAYKGNIEPLLACCAQDEICLRSLTSQPLTKAEQRNLLEIYYFVFRAKNQEIINFLFNTLPFEISPSVLHYAIKFLKDADSNVLFLNDLMRRSELSTNMIEVAAEKSSLDLLWFIFETDCVEYIQSDDDYLMEIKQEFEYDLSIDNFFERATSWAENVVLTYGGFPENNILANNLINNSDLLRILKSIYKAFKQPTFKPSVVDMLIEYLEKGHQNQHFNLYYRFFLKCLHDSTLNNQVKDYIENEIIPAWKSRDLTNEQKYFMKLLQRIPTELPVRNMRGR